MTQEINELLEERGKTHGDFSNVALVAQSIKRTLHFPKGCKPLQYNQREAIDMIASKLARIVCAGEISSGTQLSFLTTLRSLNKMEYEDFVASRIKDPADIADSIDSVKANLIHMILGISGEAGELLDAVKKHTMYGKPLDIDNVIEELGDIEFYLEGLRQHLAVSRATILKRNQEKLTKRYPVSYSDQAAIARADKLDEQGTLY